MQLDFIFGIRQYKVTMKFRRFSAFFLVGFFVVLSAILLSSKPALSDWTNDLLPPTGTVKIGCGNDTPGTIPASGQVPCSVPPTASSTFTVVAGCEDGLSGCSALKYAINNTTNFVSATFNCQTPLFSAQAPQSTGQTIISGPNSVTLKDVYDCAGNHILSPATFNFTFCPGPCGPPVTPPVDTPTLTPSATPTTATNTPTATPTNPVVTLPPNWFQGVGGDMRRDWTKGFTDPIPVSPTPLYASIQSLVAPIRSQTPGVIYSGGSGSPNLGGGQPSSKGWLVLNNPYAQNLGKSTSYYTLLFKTNNEPKKPLDSYNCADSFSGCDLKAVFGNGNGVYATSNSIFITVASNASIPAGSYTLLVDGNVTIIGDIKLDPGAFLLISSSKNITVLGKVTHMDGFYSADQNFTVENLNPSASSPLTIEGNVVANAEKTSGQNYSFSNQRELADPTNPSVIIVERPDMILSYPEYLRKPNYIWQEVAP